MSSSFRVSKVGIFFCFMMFFIFCRQFSIGFKSGLLPGQIKHSYFLLLEKIRNFFGLMAWSIVLHEDFKAVNVKHAEHVLLQHFYILIVIHFFVIRQEIQASPAHFPRKSSPYHDCIRVLYRRDCEHRVKSIRGMRVSNDKGSHSEHLTITLIRKHNSFPLRRRPLNVFFCKSNALLFHSFC